MKSFRKMLAVMIILGVTGIKGWSYYYSDGFSSLNATYWTVLYKYSRSRGIWNESSAASYSVASSYLEFTGRPFAANGSGIYNTELSAVLARFINNGVTYNASPEHPFGYEVTVRDLMLDSDSTLQKESGREKTELIFYLADNTTAPSAVGSHFDNAVTVVNFFRPQLGINDGQTSEPNTQTFSFWAWDEAGTRSAKFNFATAQDPRGGTQGANLSNYTEWCYDNYYGTNSSENTMTGGTPWSYYENSNVWRIRMVTDGKYVYFYFNPAPNGTVYGDRTLRNGTTHINMTNTYYLVASQAITFSNNIQPLFGIGNNRVDANSTSDRVDFDDFLIRQVCSSVTSEIYPSTVKAGSTVVIRGYVKPTFNDANDAGVQEMYIDLPGGRAWTTDLTNRMRIAWVDDGAIVKSFVNQGSITSRDVEPSGAGYVRMSLVTSNRLKVRFYAAAASTAVFDYSNVNGYSNPAIMFILSNYTTSAVADSTGESFAIYVNNEKYPDSAWARTATTGKQKSFAGNYMTLGSIDDDTLTLKTVNDPLANAGIRPVRIYEGMESAFYYDVSASNANNNANVTKVMIQVPAGFTIDSSSLGSDRLDNAYFTVTGTNTIIADYYSAGVKLIAGSGIDTIHFNNTTTTNFENTNEIATFWPSVAGSWIDGTGLVTTTTNSMYPSQRVMVRKRPPAATAYIFSQHDVKNTMMTNVYTYVVQNGGLTGNNIKKVLIRMDLHLTNVANISSGLVSVRSTINSNDGHTYISVDYSAAGVTNLMSGCNDTITFTGWDNVPSLNASLVSASFPSYADNGNGDGYVAVSEAADTWDVNYYTPPCTVQAQLAYPNADVGAFTNQYYHYVYTDLTNSYKVEVLVKNFGEKENNIYYATIACPPSITNVISANSSQSGLTRITNMNGTNFVHIAYTNAAAGLLTAGATPALGEADTVTLFCLDNITVSNTVAFKVTAQNTSNYNTSASSIGNENNMKLVYVYAPPAADSYVEIPLTYIKTESDGTNIVYHIFNRGRPGNIIRSATIHFDPSYISNVVFLSNRLYDVSQSQNYSGGNFTVNYNAGNFHGGTNDAIYLRVYDTVDSGEVYFNATCSVQNDRWTTNNIGTTSSKSQVIHINPPLTWYAYRMSPTIVFNNASPASDPTTNCIVLSVSNAGVGSNLLDRVKTQIPAELLGKIVMVSNAFTGLTNETGGDVNVSGGYITVNYTNFGGLPSGSVDRTYIWVRIDSTNAYHSYWTTLAQNNSQPSYTNCLTMLAEDGNMATNLVSVVDEPFGNITPSQVLTPSTANNFSYYVQNGDNATGRSVKAIRLGFPSYVSAISNLSGWGAVTAQYNTGSEQYVVVSNTSAFSPNSTCFLTFKAYDTWTTGSNSILTSMEVNYNDGSGWHESYTYTGKSKVITFVNPTANGSTYATPDTTPQDWPYYDYCVYIKNKGETGNDLHLVRIVAPSFITNMDMVLSTNIHADCEVSSNVIYVYYTNTSKVLTSGMADWITFRAYDNVDAPNTATGAWSVAVNNTTDPSGYVAATPQSLSALAINIKNPGYAPYASIEVKDPVYAQPTSPNYLYSTISNETMYFTIYNQSGTSGNNITGARLKIPVDGILDITNVSSTNHVSCPVWVSNDGYIYADYASSPLAANAYDTIRIVANDTITHSETNSAWSAEVAFNTTYGIYKPASVYTGKLLTVYYIMPDPQANVTMTPSEIYLNKPSLTLNYAVSNTGDGTSDISRLTITLPAVFRTGFSISKISNTFAASTNYNPATGVITLTYTGNAFAPGKVDNLYLSLSNTSTAYSEGLLIDSSVVNYVKTGATTVDSNKTMVVSTVPTITFVTNDVDTTTFQNGFVFTFNNAISGYETIKRVKLQFPPQFTNVLSYSTPDSSPVVSTNGFTNGQPVITLDYSGDPIVVGNSAYFYLTLQDDLNIGNVTNGVRAWVDNGDGYVPFRLASLGSTNIFFNMPATSSESSIDPSAVFLGVYTNEMTVFITNKATGTGNISYARITLPEVFSNVNAVTSSLGGVVDYDDFDRQIKIAYTNLAPDYFGVGQEEQVHFKFYSLFDSVTNADIFVETANLTNFDDAVFTVSRNNGNTYSKVLSRYPPYSAEGYFAGDNRLYLIETNATLTYRIINRSYNTAMREATIVFNTNIGKLFEKITLASSASTTNKPITLSTNGGANTSSITIFYKTGDVGYSENDDLSLTFDYHFTNIFRFVAGSWVVVSNKSDGTVSNVTAMTLHSYNSNVIVTNSSWGVISGTIYPVIHAVNVKMYYPNTSIFATNESGVNLGAITSTASGKYFISRIPAGTYKMTVLGGDYYRDFSTNITVLADKILTIPSITMRNAPLTGLANNQQIVYCYTNTNTYIMFPAEGIMTNKEFSIDIRWKLFTQPQAANELTNVTLIKTPGSPGGTNDMYGYLFELNDYDDNPIAGAVIELDAYLHIGYDQADIESRQWSESDLAIYYWDYNGVTGRWVRIGGAVDAEHNAVVASVGYVHEFYAVMSKSAETSPGIIQNVVLRPKVFTPTQNSTGYFGNVRLTFEISGDAASYAVSIFDLAGNIVKTYESEGTYNQGEVSWDGTDVDGFAVKSGVYIYRIVAGGESYAGTVIIAR